MADSVVVPGDVREWVRSIFAACNREVAAKISRVPMAHETSLDLTLIERLSHFGSPVRFPSEWLVRIETHYLGGGRHFGAWEIADVGLLVVFRRGGRVVRTKVALLQSKRLYPDEEGFNEDQAVDYILGFARLMQGDESFLRVSEPRQFSFSGSSRYKAFRVGDRQVEAIRQYEERYGIPVHYLFYHPLTLPYTQVVPLMATATMSKDCEAGCRVLAARIVNDTVGKFEKGYSPAFDDLRSIPTEATQEGRWPGWRLEEFVVDRVMDCRDGYLAAGLNDEGLMVVFNQRSGPIAAAVAITFDIPG